MGLAGWLRPLLGLPDPACPGWQNPNISKKCPISTRPSPTKKRTHAKGIELAALSQTCQQLYAATEYVTRFDTSVIDLSHTEKVIQDVHPSGKLLDANRHVLAFESLRQSIPCLPQIAGVVGCNFIPRVDHSSVEEGDSVSIAMDVLSSTKCVLRGVDRSRERAMCARPSPACSAIELWI